MTRRVTKAVFPVAGLGTRFLPATKSIPKEILTLVDRPLIQYAIDEARAAGITEFIFVTARGKSALEDYFDRAPELESALRTKGKTDLLEVLDDTNMDSGAIAYIRQHQALGLGHAVWCAKRLIGDEPFAVILPDDVIAAAKPCLQQMVEAYAEIGGCMVAAMEVPSAQTSSYGVLDVDLCAGPVLRVKGMVEKPAPGAAPSNLAVIGRYILTPEVLGHLDRKQAGTGRGNPAHRRHRRGDPARSAGERLPLPRPALRLRLEIRLPAGDSRLRAGARRPQGRIRRLSSEQRRNAQRGGIGTPAPCQRRHTWPICCGDPARSAVRQGKAGASRRPWSSSARVASTVASFRNRSTEPSMLLSTDLTTVPTAEAAPRPTASHPSGTSSCRRERRHRGFPRSWPRRPGRNRGRGPNGKEGHGSPRPTRAATQNSGARPRGAGAAMTTLPSRICATARPGSCIVNHEPCVPCSSSTAAGMSERVAPRRMPRGGGSEAEGCTDSTLAYGAFGGR
jgi:UTP--glucose-1-phosphate uridylyltransferase